VTWLAAENEAVAEAMRQAALRSIGRIVERPRLGHSRPELAAAPFGFWRVLGFPYLIVYNAARTPPRVVRVLHMKRDLPPLLANLAASDIGPRAG
jgi:toxin ParE1/3/4